MINLSPKLCARCRPRRRWPTLSPITRARMRRLCNANSSNSQRNSNPSRLPGPAPWALIAQSRLADEMSKLNETDIQGFVLRGYNMPFARYMFLRFEDPVQARILIGQLLS